jgi:hypothetical protein
MSKIHEKKMRMICPYIFEFLVPLLCFIHIIISEVGVIPAIEAMQLMNRFYLINNV